MVGTLNKIEIDNRIVSSVANLPRHITRNIAVLFCNLNKLGHDGISACEGQWVGSGKENPDPFPFRSSSKFRELICEKYDQIWNQMWSEHESCHQMKMFWPRDKFAVLKCLLKLTKPKLKQVVQLMD